MKKLSYIYFVVALLFSFTARAQTFSYVYIQGDKETPFYVKVEDQMQPRYGKDYCIIPQLAPGAINIQVLFQQNVYPPQKFTVIVPENGFRGFILTHKGNAFSLYDLQQQFYLPAGNSIEDDHAPAVNPNARYISKPNAVPEKPVAQEQAGTEQTVTNNTVATDQPQQAEQTNTQQNGQPQFIANIEFHHDNNTQPETVQANIPVQQAAPTPAPQPAPSQPVTLPADEANNQSAINKAGIVNSDCPDAMSQDDIDDLYRTTVSRSDKSRLKFLLGRVHSNCFTTAQVRQLTKTLNNDPERYSFLKQVYSRVTDQSNFHTLENLLYTNEWKSYFRLIMP